MSDGEIYFFLHECVYQGVYLFQHACVGVFLSFLLGSHRSCLAGISVYLSLVSMAFHLFLLHTSLRFLGTEQVASD